jgi:predicted small metal-binding protein|tara:strand:- start:373 stop:609 length:237 start_codon:yes stop_codon:yes gene_type:complete
MKTMTCRQLGGACEQEFRGISFEEIGEMSKQHAMQMLKKNDADHLAAMDHMLQLIETPDAMAQWCKEKRQEFTALPEN